MTYPFASSFSNPSGSPIRELFPYLRRPGMISFAGGYPSPALMDIDGLQDAAAKAFSSGAQVLQYGATEGLPVLQDQLLALCQARGVMAGRSELLVTTGSQQAFDLLLKIFIEPGDVVAIESPAYPAAIQALRLAGAVILEVATDADGIKMDALRETLERQQAGKRIKFLYTVPSFSNPSGALMKAERRVELVQLALEHEFLVIEDDPYGEISFDETERKSIYSYGAAAASKQNPVLYLSSLSKTVAPSLRIGWMVAPESIVRRAAIAKQTSDLCSSPVTQLIAAEYLKAGRYPSSVASARRVYGERMNAMADALSEALTDELRFVRPKGGMFLWAQLSPQVDGKRLFEAAVEAGVIFVPGSAFFAKNGIHNAMRFSFAAPNVAEIRQGVSRLVEAVQAVNLH